jgi:hypothetical protein
VVEAVLVVHDEKDVRSGGFLVRVLSIRSFEGLDYPNVFDNVAAAQFMVPPGSPIIPIARETSIVLCASAAPRICVL